MTHRSSAARLRPFRVPSPARKWNAPSIQKAMIGMRCGQPSGRTVASQWFCPGAGCSRRSRATSQGVVSVWPSTMGVSVSGVRAAVVIVSLPCIAEGCPPGQAEGLDRHASRARDRVDQLQVVCLALLREEPQPVADDDRIDPEVELVDEVALEQPPEQLAAAVDLELAPRPRLELADRGL